MAEKDDDENKSPDRVDWTSGMGAESANSEPPNSEACTREFDLPATESDAKRMLMEQRHRPRTELAPARNLMHDNESELKALLRSRKEDGKHTTSENSEESKTD